MTLRENEEGEININLFKRKSFSLGQFLTLTYYFAVVSHHVTISSNKSFKVPRISSVFEKGDL